MNESYKNQASPPISLIAAIDEANGIGYHNQLLCHLPEDLRRFKQITLGKPVIMGRKTFVSIGKILPGRLNIIVSQTMTKIDGALIVDSLEAAISHSVETTERFIIGGERLFYDAMTRAARLYITKIHHHFKADVFFPAIDETIWHCESQEFYQKDEKNQYDMTFLVYSKK